MNKADAASLDAGDVYSAVKLYGLTVAAKEVYMEGQLSFSHVFCQHSTSFQDSGYINY